jgi:UDP-N-acetylglucosamine acyltransferase
MELIDPRAVVDGGASLAPGVHVGPFAVIGPGVSIGKGTLVESAAFIAKDTTIGEDCYIGHGAVLGTDPQDLKYRNERTFLTIGSRTRIREYATVHRASGEGGATVVGQDVLVMAYAHIAHNCVIGNSVVIANSVNLGGHVVIEDHAIVGGMTPVHQFVRIGAYSFVGGLTHVSKDVPPYFKVAGVPMRPIDVNTVGLVRHGFPADARKRIRRAFRILYLSDLNTSQAVARIREELPMTPEIQRLLDFIRESSRGIAK